MLNFRKAEEKDIEIAASIYDEIHTLEEQGVTCVGWIRGVYPTYDTAKMAFDRGDLFVAENDRKIIGTAIINKIQMDSYKDAVWQYDADDKEIMVLHTLVISQKEANKGYGKEFVNFYEEYSLSQGCRYLRMDTNAKNTRARTLYKKLGYKEIGIVGCTFNGIEGVSLVLLEKKIG